MSYWDWTVNARVAVAHSLVFWDLCSYAQGKWLPSFSIFAVLYKIWCNRLWRIQSWIHIDYILICFWQSVQTIILVWHLGEILREVPIQLLNAPWLLAGSHSWPPWSWAEDASGLAGLSITIFLTCISSPDSEGRLGDGGKRDTEISKSY